MRYFLTFILLFLHNICDAQEKIYKSNVCCSRTVTIVNDTVLKYFERIGSFSNKGTLKYKLDNGIFTVERKPNKYQKSAFTLGNDLNGSELKISKDSLVILKTGAVFYDEKFLEQKVEKEFVNFYLIKDKKKIFITSNNLKQIFNELDFENYEVIEINKRRAKRKYGIDTKYETIKLKRK